MKAAYSVIFVNRQAIKRLTEVFVYINLIYVFVCFLYTSFSLLSL